MFVSCDRIEDGYAVLVSDDETVYTLPLHSLPFDVREGDTLVAHINNGSLTVLGHDDEQRKSRQERILSMFEKLKEKRNKPQ